MTEDKTKRLTVYLPDRVKSDLSRMAEQTGLSMTQLIVMATHSLLANYQERGSAVFAGLIDARHRESHSLAGKMAALNRETALLQEYYGARAYEYERIYHRNDPDFQQELAILSQQMTGTLLNKSVLEVACGTGYWTERAVKAAKRIVGIDIRPEVLQIAREKGSPEDKVRFELGDAYKLASVPGEFDAGLANFWFSHIPRNRIDDFLTGFHDRLGTGAAVFMADNVYVEGRGGELIVKEDSEDTFKLRELADGSKHEIVKNYYSKEELQRIFKPHAKNLDIFVGSSFWYVSYITA
ncbi:methyltransferase domain-containing protein [Paenibacillus sp. P26]|nr:methyltransferase domain-containing protein [Paenibacillus sp. P26]UUZ92225.1 methyltransferase domain-containing protein [Paenibacillus sp. P25]